ncbi:MAG: tetratricopeptide repeat protein [Candidatus Omnitrophica bacterium]|nr:tetratricopeptide repeat protein [Candidatus Omnitrophota bacterium]
MLMNAIFKNKIAVIVLLAGACLAYGNSLGGGFVYDDKAMILAYDLVQDLGNIPRAFVSPTSLYGNVNYYRPLQTVTYIVDYYLWGRLAGGFHFTNLLLHLACVFCLFRFLRLIFRDTAVVFTASLLFAVHPVHATVVSYIAGRADSLLLFFFLASFYSHVKYAFFGKAPAWRAAELLFFLLALLSKELAMVIPFLFLLFDKKGFVWTDLKPVRTSYRGYIPHFVLLGVYLWFRFAKMSFFVEGAIAPFPFENRLITVPYLLFQYIRLIILPNDLHIGRIPWVAPGILSGRIIFSSAAVLFLLGYLWKGRKNAKEAWFGALWFIILIFPSLNVVTPLFYTFAENWLYIPSIGLFLILSKKSFDLYRGLEREGRKALKAVAAAAGLLFVISMVFLAIGYNRTWKDEISLGLNTLRYNPREFKVYNNIGVAYLGRGDLDRAEEAFWKCLEIKPDTGMAYFNLYRIYKIRGKHKEAREYLERAKYYDPKRVNILIDKLGIRD